ncbi:BON domain-containing protein [Cupriavidus sp. 2MCAB6]|uniref:BON domain-containing protein n=1 Tax=Cupriavidus sp. 2MCAB6 TaxID=3232981 RepID=UPI003F92FBBD
MKSIQKMWLASVVGLLAASGNAAARGDVGRILAATDGAPPMNSAPGTPGLPEAPSNRTVPKDNSTAMGKSAPSAESSTKLSDSAITMKVKAELLASKVLRPNGIRVRTENGVVHLDGKVQNDSEKLTALNAVRAVDGVQSVVDGLQVGK